MKQVWRGCPATGPDGIIMNNNLYSVSANGASGVNRNYISISNLNSGVTLNEIDTLTSQGSISSQQQYPRIDGRNDTIVLTWQERVGSDWKIYCAVSTNLTGSHINDLNAFPFQSNDNDDGIQENPEIKYSNGKVH